MFPTYGAMYRLSSSSLRLSRSRSHTTATDKCTASVRMCLSWECLTAGYQAPVPTGCVGASEDVFLLLQETNLHALLQSGNDCSPVLHSQPQLLL